MLRKKIGLFGCGHLVLEGAELLHFIRGYAPLPPCFALLPASHLSSHFFYFFSHFCYHIVGAILSSHFFYFLFYFVTISRHEFHDQIFGAFITIIIWGGIRFIYIFFGIQDCLFCDHISSQNNISFGITSATHLRDNVSSIVVSYLTPFIVPFFRFLFLFFHSCFSRSLRIILSTILSLTA